MKTMMRTIFFAASAAFCILGMAGCSNEMMEDGATQAGKQATMTLQGTTDGPQTRADYTEDATDDTKMNFSWRSGDKIGVAVDGGKVYDGVLAIDQLTTQAEGKSAPFSGTTDSFDGTKTIYALYPYSTTRYADIKGNGINATVDLDLPELQKYTISEAISNSYMVGMGTATATPDGNITASASLTQVMSIIKLNITNAPAKVTGVKLKCAEEVFATMATVKLSDATITNPAWMVSELAMTVTDGTTGTDKAVSFAIFPADLTGKEITIEVTFNDGGKDIVKSEKKTGINFVRNMHYVMAFDGKPATPDFLVVNGIKVAVGNLVADGANGAKIGAPGDYGLYFQFGSLIGWAGGATGDGTGVLASNTPGYAFNATGTVVPSDKSIPATWGDPDRWTGTTGTVPAANDPCTRYLGADWRLPTKDEYMELFKDQTNLSPTSSPWKWDADSKSAKHTDGLTFPASGSRYNHDGSLSYVGTTGYYWSASPNDDSLGYNLSFLSSIVNPSRNLHRAFGYPVRCVQASN